MTQPGQLALLVLGSLLSGSSALCALAGLLELLVILGPIACCTSWWLPNLALLVAWPPVLGLAGWQLHSGWAPALPYVILGALFACAHMVLLFAYWLRRTLRRQAAMELPTQQLLTEAHRMMLTGAVEAAPWGLPYLSGGTSTDTSPPLVNVPPNQFQLQVGRTDGAPGYTLYIPAEAEEVAIMEAAARLQHQRQLQAAAAAAASPDSDEKHSRMGSMDRHPAMAGPTGGSVPPSPSVRSVGFGGFGGGAPPPFSTPTGRHSRHNSAGGASQLAGMSAAAQAGGASAGGAPQAAPKSVIRVLVPENLPRWGSSGNRRYRALEGGPSSGVTSPVGSMKRSAVQAVSDHAHQHAQASSYVPPPASEPTQLPVVPMVTGVVSEVGRGGNRPGAGSMGGSGGAAGQQQQQHGAEQQLRGPASMGGPRGPNGGVLESSNPLLQEYGLQYMAGSRMAPSGPADQPQEPAAAAAINSHHSTSHLTHSRSPSGDVHAAARLPLPASPPSSSLAGAAWKPPATVAGPVSDHATVVDQFSAAVDASPVAGVADAHTAGGDMGPLAMDRGRASSMRANSMRANSMRALIEAADSSTGGMLEPRSPVVASDRPSTAAASPAVAEKPPGADPASGNGKKAGDKKLGKPSHRSRHSRTHSWAHSTPFGLPLLEQTDSSADVPPHEAA